MTTSHRIPASWTVSQKFSAHYDVLVLVRDLVEKTFRSWGLSEISWIAKIVANEFATNAVQATPGGHFEMTLTLRPLDVLIEVWDASPAVPRMMVPAEAADERPAMGDILESGRGLFIVESLARRCGWSAAPGERGGKTVWAVIPRHPPEDQPTP